MGKTELVSLHQTTPYTKKAILNQLLNEALENYGY